jgi:truncated hemoglobin YjbI
MGIGKADFDAVIEDMNATLDTFKVSGREKEEFLALLRPMRKDIVEKP